MVISEEELMDTIRKAWAAEINWDECVHPELLNLLQIFAKSGGTTQEFLLFGMLPAAASLVSDARVIVEPGWTECLNIGAIILADPGAGKSPAHAEVIRPVQKLIANTVLDNFTIKGLHSHLSSGITSALIAPDEGDKFIQMCIAKNSSADRSLFNQLLDGTEATMARSCGGSGGKASYTQVPSCAVGILVLTWARTFLREQITKMVTREDGLMDRFLLLCPKPVHTLSKDRREARTAREQLPTKLQTLSDLYGVVEKYHSVAQREYCFSDEAQVALEEDRDDHTRRMINQVDQLLVGNMSSPSTKAVSSFKTHKLTPKVACLLHIYEQAYSCVEGSQDWALEIQLSTVKRAQNLMSYLREQRHILLKVVRELEAKSSKQLSERAIVKTLLMQPGPFINPRKGSKAFSSSHGLSGEKLLPVLRNMEKEGLGKYVEEEGQQGLIKTYPLEASKLQNYDLTPKKYRNALQTTQEVKSQVLTTNQTNFFLKSGGAELKRRLFQSESSGEEEKEEDKPTPPAKVVRHTGSKSKRRQHKGK